MRTEAVETLSRPSPSQVRRFRRCAGAMVLACSILMVGTAAAQVGSGPTAAPMPPALPAPLDRQFHGTIELAINATDTNHQIFSVHETIPVQASGDTVLLYPEWETASHAPTATEVELAGLMVHIDDKSSDWTRDPVDMHAIHVIVPRGARTITLDFQFLANAQAHLLRPDMVIVPWQRVLLYPAGWYVRDISVAATLALPQGLTPFTALASHPNADGTLGFQSVTLEQLVDAPVYAGRYTRRVTLNGSTAAAVALDLLADAKESVAITRPEIEHMESLVAQALKVFGTVPYRHYDAIITLSDVLSPDGGGGVEHLEEGENNLPAAYFTNTAEQLNDVDLVAHEFVHAWNGRWRQPADLWSPTFNQPVGGSLLWVYEGQTEFWGRVLAARAGLRDHQQTIDRLAMDAAIAANRTGRRWKDLQDNTNDAVYMAKHRVEWPDWQRREDYYPEGVLLWLDVDARLREISHGERSIDDFARAFFAKDHAQSTRTYTFQDVCDALDKLAPNDWATFLNQHLHGHSADDAIAGLTRAGWKLVYTDVPSETFRQAEEQAGAINLNYSVGLQVNTDGRVLSVQWDSPAFRVGLSPGSKVLEVDEQPYSTRTLLAAIESGASKPLTMGVEINGGKRVVKLDYRGGLRYPHLERIAGAPDRLSALLGAR